MSCYVGFKLDRREVDRFAEKLAVRLPQVAREATAMALNRTAKAAELLAKRNIKQGMTLRNKWTLGSIKSTRTPPSRPIAKQFTMVGSKQPYLELQEKGGALKRTNVGRRITTARGSREGPTAFPRRKVAKGKHAPRNIRFARVKGVKGSAGRQAKVTVEIARRKKQRFVFLRLRADRAGIFEVQKRSIRMVHRVLRRRVSVPARPWLEPAVNTARKTAPEVFRIELLRRFRP